MNQIPGNTAQTKLHNINHALANGRTVYVCTYTRATKVTPKSAAQWAKSGNTLFKVSGNSLYMARGRQFDCIDGCALQYE